MEELFTGFTSTPIPELGGEPYGITSFEIDEENYEYIRRYTTLNAPANARNVVIDKLFIFDWLTIGDYEPKVLEPKIEPLVQILSPRRVDNTRRGFYVKDTVGIGVTVTQKIDKTIQLFVDTTYNPDATLAIKSVGDVSIIGSLIVNETDISTLLSQLDQRITALETP